MGSRLLFKVRSTPLLQDEEPLIGSLILAPNERGLLILELILGLILAPNQRGLLILDLNLETVMPFQRHHGLKFHP